MASIRREIVLEADPEEVWSALTEPERLEEWFAGEVDLDPSPGGEGVFRWANGEERHAVVEEVEPGRRLAFRWRGEGSGETTVAISLLPVPQGTQLTVVECGPLACEWSWALSSVAHAPVLV